MTSLTVCILTYRRPGELRRLLGELARQDIGGTDVAVSVLVVDNDPSASGLPVVAEVSPGFPFPLRGVHETRRGISQARNRALDETAASDLIAFIDDDELPVRDWIAQLLRMWARTGAQAVMGRIVPEFDGPAPAWAVRGRFYEHPCHEDGQEITYAYTGNVLLDRRAVAGAGLRFDEALGLSGGEDICFFAQARERGLRIVWSAHAAVSEIVPADRIRLRWLLRRWYRTGNTDALMLLRRLPGAAGRLRGLGMGIARVGAGTAAFALCAVLAPLGRTHVPVGRLYTLARGLGMIGAALGSTYQEYRSAGGT